MINRSRTIRWTARAALGGAVALSILSVVATSLGQPPSPTSGGLAAKGAAPGGGSGRDDLVAAQARDRLEVLEAQLEAKRSLLRIDDSRAEQAKRWRAYYEKLVRDGKVIEDRMLAARDDVLMMEAHVAAEQADLRVAEIRVKYALRHAEHGGQATAGAEQAREELDVLVALLKAKRDLLQVGEARAEQARRTESHYDKLFRSGMATDDLVLAARDNVLTIDSVLAWGRADVRVTEMRVKNARQLASRGGSAADGAAHNWPNWKSARRGRNEGRHSPARGRTSATRTAS